MTDPVIGPGPRVLLVDHFDDGQHHHGGLRQRALERLGCAVTTLNLARTGWLDRLSRRDLAARLERACRQITPELVIVVGDDPVSAEELRVLRGGSHSRWVHWYPRPVDPTALAGAYDLLLLPTEALGREARHRLGCWSLVLPPACDPSFHRPLRVRDPFRSNLVFAGTATPYRESVLQELAEFGLVLWGPGWKKTGLRDYCLGEALSAENYVRANAGATVALNLGREAPETTDRDSVLPRLYEIAAIGTAQIADRAAEAGAGLDPESEVLVGKKPAAVKTAVRRLLAEAALREELSSAARRTVLRRHTYMHRMAELLKAVSKGLRTED